MRLAIIFVITWSLSCKAIFGQEEVEIRIDKESYKDSRLQITDTVKTIEAQDVWQTGPYCGANCLFVLLSLKDVKVTYSQVKALVTTTNDGANLLELRDAAKSLGLDCQVAEVAPMNFETVPLPFIALLGSKKNQQVKGHYVVVYDVTSDYIMSVDGTTGNKDKFDRSFFAKSYSGYIMSPKEGKIIDALGQTEPRTFSISTIFVILNMLFLLYQIISLKRI